VDTKPAGIPALYQDVGKQKKLEEQLKRGQKIFNDRDHEE
jgi:hypothetical protein